MHSRGRPSGNYRARYRTQLRDAGGETKTLQIKIRFAAIAGDIMPGAHRTRKQIANRATPEYGGCRMIAIKAPSAPSCARI